MMTYEQVHKFLEVKQREMTKNRGLYNEIEISINGKAIEAVEKQIPKKPIIRLTGQMCGNWIRSCPTCNAKLVERVTTVDISVPHIYNNSNFCIKCGQRLNWEND